MPPNNVHVAIIDDGVAEAAFNIKLLHNIEIDNTLTISPRTNYDHKAMNHGTLCAAIIKTYSAHTEISSIKILNSSKGSAEQLYAAINWCLANNVLVANISLGSFSFSDYTAMRTIINEAAHHGLVFVCASQNGDLLTYPASLSNTIGVKCDRNKLLSKREYCFRPHLLEGVEITAFAQHALQTISGGILICPNNNSFAAPLITAKVCDYIAMHASFSLEEIKYYLKVTAPKPNFSNTTCIFYKNPDWISNAVIFSCSQAPFSSANFYFNVVQKIAVSIGKLFITVCEFLNASKNAVFDTIVIIDNENLYKTEIPKVLQLAGEYRKDIVYIDSSGTLPISATLRHTKFWYGSFRFPDFAASYNASPAINTPVIYLLLPTNFDSFYFLQNLKTCCMQNGYNPVIISEMPIAVLYDLEYCPSHISKLSGEIVSYLSELLCKTNADILFYSSYQKASAALSPLLTVDLLLDLQTDPLQCHVRACDNADACCPLPCETFGDAFFAKLLKTIENLLDRPDY